LPNNYNICPKTIVFTDYYNLFSMCELYYLKRKVKPLRIAQNLPPCTSTRFTSKQKSPQIQSRPRFQKAQLKTTSVPSVLSVVQKSPQTTTQAFAPIRKFRGQKPSNPSNPVNSVKKPTTQEKFVRFVRFVVPSRHPPS